MPKALISDRGTHFYNKIMERTMKIYGVNHRFSTSYHPQTSGQVENTNRALKRILEKTVKDNPAIWSRKLDDAIWAFRTAYKTPTGTTPYKLIYGKNCHLPFEIKHRAYWALKNYNPDLIAAGEKRMFQLHELDELRHQAYENSRLYKARTKVWHDRKLRMRKEFKQGNKVLLFHSNYKFKQPKLRSRWLYNLKIWKIMKSGQGQLSRSYISLCPGKYQITFSLNDLRIVLKLPQATDNDHAEFVEDPELGTMIKFLNILGMSSLSAHESFDQESGGNSKGRGMGIPDYLLAKVIMQTKGYRLYAADFKLVVPMMQSQPAVSSHGTHRTPSDTRREPDPEAPILIAKRIDLDNITEAQQLSNALAKKDDVVADEFAASVLLSQEDLETRIDPLSDKERLKAVKIDDYVATVEEDLFERNGRVLWRLWIHQSPHLLDPLGLH
ncbi:reverse transcriptase domain-containing protein [Tanacetum coccineum]